MAEAFPLEVERLASFGKALEGTINITQDDIDEVPSDDGSPSASLEALPSDKVKLLEALLTQFAGLSNHRCTSVL